MLGVRDNIPTDIHFDIFFIVVRTSVPHYITYKNCNQTRHGNRTNNSRVESMSTANYANEPADM